ncbi:MAG: DegT/DnrJ/EryC1/StrS family aminotransferase, partial [Anaerolineaceae bacterium]
FLETTLLTRPALPPYTEYNYGYYPILLKSEEQLLETKSALNQQEIYPRRYFFPSLNKLPIANHVPQPMSDQIAKRVLCLPLYAEIDYETVEKIAQIVMKDIT